MTIAVTAATGQLGGFVLADLLTTEPADRLVAIVRDPGRAGHLRDQGIEVRAARYDDKAGYVKALAGVDKLLLVSGLDFGQRVQQHTNVIEAAAQAGVSLLAYTSAPHADASALPIAAEHKATEQVLAASGIPHVFLRNNWYTEMFTPAIDLARRTGAVWSNAPTGRIASASRVDYATAAGRVLATTGHEGKVYELTGDYAWNYDELAAALSGLLGQPVTHRTVTPVEHSKILVDHGSPEFMAHFAAELDETIEQGHLADATDSLRTLIGRPTTPLVDGLRAVLTVAAAGSVRDQK